MLGAIAVLAVAGIFSTVAKYDVGSYNVFRAYDLDEERTVPTFFSSMSLLLSSVLLGILAFASWSGRDRWKVWWTVLSVVFLTFAIDEVAGFHEATIEPVQSFFGGLGGPLTFAWVVPGMAFTAVFAVWSIPFLRALPSDTRRLFLLAGGLYLSGVLGVEMVTAAYKDAYGFNLGFGLLSAVEEVLEMTGIAVFVYALMRHIGATVRELRLTIGAQPEDRQDQ